MRTRRNSASFSSRRAIAFANPARGRRVILPHNPTRFSMAILQVPIPKAKGQFMPVDTDRIDEEKAKYYTYAMLLGLKVILNRNTKIKKGEYKTEAEFQKAVMDFAAEQVEKLYAGEGIRVVGMARAKASKGKETVEARRLARDYVKASLRA